MKRGDIDLYLNTYPDLLKWINECPICHAKGYRPDMPDTVGSSLFPEFAARYIRKNLKPLPVDDMGFCNTCSRLIKRQHSV